MLHVAINVGVVELDARQDRRARAVVEKLWSLVEISGVVLVSLDNDEWSGTVAEVAIVVERHAANEKRWIRAGGDQHVSHQCRGGCLPVRADDDHAVLSSEQQRSERRWKAHLRNATLSHRGCLRILTANDVADDHEVGPRPIEIL